MKTILYIASILPLNDDKLFDNYYNQLTYDRVVKTNSYVFKKDKIKSVASEVLLKYGLKDFSGKDIPLEYVYLNSNKPYLFNSDVYFNISHSNEYVIIAISDNDIGCDIEYIHDIDLNLAKKFFNEEEYCYIINSNNKIDTFYRYWTLKESFIKNIGLGLNLPLNSFKVHIDDDNVTIEQNYDNFNYNLKEINYLNDYHISICSKDDLENIIIKNIDLKNLKER